MEITGANHTIGRVPLGKRPIVSLRAAPSFILRLRPDPSFVPAPTRDYDHLALVVVGADTEALARHLREVGVEIERRLEKSWARGEGEVLYVRDPERYLIGLKLYDPRPQRSGDEAG